MTVRHQVGHAVKRQFFDSSIDAYFHTNEDGITAFYPGGIFGRRGVVVESAEQEQDLRAAVRRAFMGIWILIAIVSAAYAAAHFAWLELLLRALIDFEYAIHWYFALKYLSIVAIGVLMSGGLVVYLRRYTAGMECAPFPNGNTHMGQMLKSNPSLLRITTLFSTIVFVLAVVLAVTAVDMALLFLIFAVPLGLFTAFLWKGVIEQTRQEKSRNVS